MADLVTFEKIDESFFKVDGPTHFCQALSEHFSFEVENLHHMRRKNPRLRFWDGKIRLYKAKNKLLPFGLASDAIDWIAANNQVDVDWITPQVQTPVYQFDSHLFAHLVSQAQKTNPDFVLAQDQVDAVKHCLEKRRVLLVSPTSSGKSFIIFAIQQHIKKKTLIIVPTIQLTTQMERNFFEYGFDRNVYRLHYGQDRSFNVEDGDVVVGTWHTLAKMPPEFYEQFDLLIGDEVHEYEADTVSKVIESCKNAYYKIGTTGSLKHSKMHKLILRGLFGPIYQAVTTKELIDQGRVSDIVINIIVLKYSEADRKEFWKQREDLDSELDWLFKHQLRTKTITELALSLSRNTFLMFQRRSQGLDLFERLKLHSGNNKTLFYVDGTVPLEKRDDVVFYFEQNDDGLGVVSLGTFKRGISINNLFHLIYTSPFKSEITTIQSIGRSLRKHSEKDRATLWDFVDDLSFNGKTNAALEHFYSRLQEYVAAGFKYTIREIDFSEIRSKD